MNSNLTKFILNIDHARVENNCIQYRRIQDIDCQVYDNYILIRNVKYTLYDNAYFEHDPMFDGYTFNEIKSTPSNDFNLIPDLVICDYIAYINEHDYYIWLAQQWLKCK